MKIDRIEAVALTQICDKNYGRSSWVCLTVHEGHSTLKATNGEVAVQTHGPRQKGYKKGNHIFNASDIKQADKDTAKGYLFLEVEPVEEKDYPDFARIEKQHRGASGHTDKIGLDVNLLTRINKCFKKMVGKGYDAKLTFKFAGEVSSVKITSGQLEGVTAYIMPLKL